MIQYKQHSVYAAGFSTARSDDCYYCCCTQSVAIVVLQAAFIDYTLRIADVHSQRCSLHPAASFVNTIIPVLHMLLLYSDIPGVCIINNRTIIPGAEYLVLLL